jgi:hypothetical protein
MWRSTRQEYYASSNRHLRHSIGRIACHTHHIEHNRRQRSRIVRIRRQMYITGESDAGGTTMDVLDVSDITLDAIDKRGTVLNVLDTRDTDKEHSIQ